MKRIHQQLAGAVIIAAILPVKTNRSPENVLLVRGRLNIIWQMIRKFTGGVLFVIRRL
jgi:hypothetical protein